MSDPFTRPPLTRKQREQAQLALLRTDWEVMVRALVAYAEDMAEGVTLVRSAYGGPDGALASAQLFNNNASAARRIASELAWLCSAGAHEDDGDGPTI